MVRGYGFPEPKKPSGNHYVLLFPSNHITLIAAASAFVDLMGTGWFRASANHWMHHISRNDTSSSFKKPEATTHDHTPIVKYHPNVP